ncbi:rh125 [macacine betaherpesvirus 3]|uniref:Rh125 n=1 Tax=Rhesus cytomegalovirus (strain 68-1) TaxID=47929 RepID=Q7TFL3_RHCM6|nr:rh125 [macacine betaherpesvirus 3]AAP50650.1 rh125 [macacine betaherpesvirus 3]
MFLRIHIQGAVAQNVKLVTALVRDQHVTFGDLVGAAYDFVHERTWHKHIGGLPHLRVEADKGGFMQAIAGARRGVALLRKGVQVFLAHVRNHVEHVERGIVEAGEEAGGVASCVGRRDEDDFGGVLRQEAQDGVKGLLLDEVRLVDQQEVEILSANALRDREIKNKAWLAGVEPRPMTLGNARVRCLHKR